MNASILNTTTSLLDSTHLIKKHTEEVNRLTGEGFNIFDLFGLTSHENSHSIFIAELLNPKGIHGQGNTFLKAFLKVLEGSVSTSSNGEKFTTNFNDNSLHNASIFTEYNLGPKTGDSGGRVDIAIHLGRTQLLIENKIYAALQERQLERYLSETGTVLFLTLGETDFEEPGEGEGILPKDPRLFHISYEHHISRWLRRCRELTATKPALREMLSQYLSLTERLSKRGGNNLMNDQLKSLITRDGDSVKAFFALTDCRHELLLSVAERLKEIGRYVARNVEGLNFHEGDFIYNKTYQGLSFQSSEWEEKKLNICMQFQKEYQNAYLGIAYTEANNDPNNDLALRLNDNFSSEFTPCPKPSNWWPAFLYFESPWRYWGADAYTDILLSDPQNGAPGSFGKLLLDYVRRTKKVMDETL